ncbi:ATP-binding protein [Myxococcus sp. K15C18031901]|nr:ATP-binding protein [Myxococcus dinghuensis]
MALGLTAASAVVLGLIRSSHKENLLELSRDLLEVERLRRAFSDKVGSGRGYALSRDPRFSREMAASREDFIATRERLTPRLAVEPEASQLRDAARAEQDHEQAVRQLLVFRSDGLPRDRKEALAEERVDVTRLRTFTALQQLSATAEARLAVGVQSAVDADQRVLVLTLVTSGLGLGLAGTLAWVLLRRLAPLHAKAADSTRRFQLLVEGVRDYALLLLDEQGRVASWNPGATRITGYQEEEALGAPLERFYPPEAVARGVPEQELERARRDGRLRTEGWRARKDGTLFFAEALINTLLDDEGRVRGFAEVTRDITERQRVERTQRLLAEAGRLFQQLLEPEQTVAELARMMVPEVADACILYVMTPSGELRPRVVKHAVPQKQVWLWDAVRDYAPPDTPQGIWQVLRTGRSEWTEDVSPQMLARDIEDTTHRKQMERVGVSSYLAVPLQVGPRAQGVLVLLMSSPRRRLTLADQVFVEELAGRAALALDNARLVREARDAVELIGVAAHDLGNPLNTLHLLLRRLRREDATPEKVREGLSLAMKQTQRLGQLLLNLLDVSWLSSERLVLDVSPVDLADLVHEVVERFSEQAHENGCKLVLDAELGLVGQWDRLRLDRVVTNLLSNALKFGRGHPVEVRAERSGPAGARVVVRDFGPGIAPESQRRIFERFEQVPSAGRHAGFGLGLYIVRQLVDAHGGTIHVESMPGEGSTFTVELPLLPLGTRVGTTPAPVPST